MRPAPDVYHTEPLAHPGQKITVEWVREAPWDRHWAVVFTGVHCRQELQRVTTFTEGRIAARRYARRVLEGRAA